MTATSPTIEHFANPRADRAGPLPGVLDAAVREQAQAAIRAWEGYGVTPLLDLPGLAGRLGIASLRWKDEGGRFGLGSFKAPMRCSGWSANTAAAASLRPRPTAITAAPSPGVPGRPAPRR